MSHFTLKTENSFKKTFLLSSKVSEMISQQTGISERATIPKGLIPRGGPREPKGSRACSGVLHLLSKVVLGLIMVTVFSASPAKASDITVATVIKLVNQAREAADVPVLTKNSLLEKAAQNKAQDMFNDNYFAHISPAGKTPWFWIENQGYDYRFAGENLAINYTDAQDEQKAWMDSPLHRKNILNADYKEIGVAVEDGIIDGHKTTVAVQMFGAQFPKAVVASAADVKPLPQANPAAVSVVTALPSASVQKSMAKIDLKSLYENNKLAVVGWLAAIGIAILIAIIDVLAIFHKKHQQLFILRDARNRHA